MMMDAWLSCMHSRVDDLRVGHSRSVGAVGVGAAVGGVLAALPCHPVPHLHRDAGLRAPSDGAAKLLRPAV